MDGRRQRGTRPVDGLNGRIVASASSGRMVLVSGVSIRRVRREIVRIGTKKSSCNTVP